jgi:hypothetical protein
MITSHLLYQLSYPSFVQPIGIEPDLRLSPALSMSYRSLPHAAEHETGNRPAPDGISESPNQSLAKERAHKARRARAQEVF